MLALGVPLALLQAGLGLAYSHLLLVPHFFDEGFKLASVDRILHGQVPYRDFYLLEGPGIYYVVAVAFKLFGPQLFTARWVVMAIALFSVTLLFALGRRILPPLPAAAASGLYVAMGLPTNPLVNNRWLAPTLSLAATGATLPFLDGRGYRWLALSGALGAAATLTHQTAASAGLALALGVTLLERRRPRTRALLALGAGALAPLVPTLLLFGAAGGLHPFLYDVVVSPFTQYVPHQTRVYLPALQGDLVPGLVELAVACLVIGLPPAIALLTLCRTRPWAAGGRLRRLLILYALVTLGMYCVALTRLDRGTAILALPLALPLTVYWVRTDLRRTTGQRRLVRTVQLALVVVAVVTPITLNWLTLHAYAALRDPSGHAVETPRGRLYTGTSGEASGVREILDFIDARVPPEGAIWVGPMRPMFYFLSGRRNPTRYDLVSPAISTLADFREVAREILQTRPRVMIWFPPDLDGGDEHFSVDLTLRRRDLLILQNVVDDCYVFVQGNRGMLELREYNPATCPAPG